LHVVLARKTRTLPLRQSRRSGRRGNAPLANVIVLDPLPIRPVERENLLGRLVEGVVLDRGPLSLSQTAFYARLVLVYLISGKDIPNAVLLLDPPYRRIDGRCVDLRRTVSSLSDTLLINPQVLAPRHRARGDVVPAPALGQVARVRRDIQVPGRIENHTHGLTAGYVSGNRGCLNRRRGATLLVVNR